MEVTTATYVHWKCIVSKCKLWKTVSYLDFVFIIIRNGQIGLPQWFSLYVKSTVISQIVSFSLPFTSINPFYICFEVCGPWTGKLNDSMKYIQNSSFRPSGIDNDRKLIQDAFFSRLRCDTVYIEQDLQYYQRPN